MSQEVYIVVDTPDLEGLELGAVEWLSYEGSSSYNWFGGTILYSQDSDGKDKPTSSMSFRFSGITFALYGNDVAAIVNKFQLSVDNRSSEAISLTSLGVQTYQRLYQSANFSEGTHTVSLSDMHGLSFDYATFLPGPTTPLRNKRVMIDDANDAINYRGSGWTVASTESAGFWMAGNIPYQLFQGGAYRTSHVGDTMIIRFTGSNIKVFGILARSGGHYTISYSMDGGVEQGRKLEYPSASVVDHVHALIVEIPFSQSAEHTVAITLTGIDGGLPLVVDYATYDAGFDDLRSMPAIGHAPSPASETSSSMILSNPIPTDTSGKIADSGHPSHPHRAVPVGGIVGGAVGLLVVVIILGGLLLVVRRKWQKPVLIEPYDTTRPIPIPSGDTTEGTLAGVHESTQRRRWHGAAMRHLPNKYRSFLAKTTHQDPPPAYDDPS